MRLWLSKKWLAPLFRGFHSSLAPTARPGSYAEKPLLRKAFCGFAVHAAKSDYSLRGLRPPNPQGFFDRLRRMSHGDMRLCSSKRASQNTSTNISAPGWRRCTGSDHLPGRIYRDGRIMAGRIPWNNRCRLHPPIAALNGNTAALPDGKYAPGYGRSPARSTGPRCSPPCEGGRSPG